MYCDRSDLNFDDDRLVQLTDSRSAPGVIDWSRVDKAISDASAYVDGVFEGKYVLPLQPVPSLVRVWSSWLSRYFLYQRRDTLPMPDGVRDDYSRALKFLTDAASEDTEIVLPCPRVVAQTPPAPGGGLLEDVPARRFGRAHDWVG